MRSMGARLAGVAAGAVWLAFAAIVPGGFAAASGISPPPAPASGPGGADYPYRSVVAAQAGSGAGAYWIFAPDGPKPAAVPLVVFLHGWGAIDPRPYRAWIDHIVRRGAIVLYPAYQSDLRTPPAEFERNAADAVKAAIVVLQAAADATRPDLDRVAYVGHSAGGNLAADLAADAARDGLPRARAIMAVAPGKSWGPERLRIPLTDLSAMPAGTLLLAVACDADRLVGDRDAGRIFRESTAVRPGDKNLVVLHGDAHGTPPLAANHLAPLAPSESSADALDFYGTWKLFDGLSDAAFFGRNRRFALGDTQEQRFMGNWSDGTPVKPLSVVTVP